MNSLTRVTMRTTVAQSHITQATVIKERLEGPTVKTEAAREMLWVIYHGHVAAATQLLEDTHTDDYD